MRPDVKVDKMENRFGNRPSVPALRKQAGRAAVVFGLWLRVGFVGAGTLVWGMSLLLDGAASPLSALALVGGGGALAALGWWRAVRALNSAEEAGGTNAPPAPATMHVASRA